jgi:hypothetical protein
VRKDDFDGELLKVQTVRHSVPGNGVGVGRGEGDAGVELGAVLQVVNGQPVRLLLIWVSVYERIR